MEDTETLEENLTDRKSHIAEITIIRKEHIVPEARGDRTLGLFEFPGRTEYKLDTSRGVMEYVFNRTDILRGSVYQGISEEAFHGVAKKVAKAETYGDAAQIVNSAVLKEYTNK